MVLMEDSGDKPALLIDKDPDGLNNIVELSHILEASHVREVSDSSIPKWLSSTWGCPFSPFFLPSIPFIYVSPLPCNLFLSSVRSFPPEQLAKPGSWLTVRPVMAPASSCSTENSVAQTLLFLLSSRMHSMRYNTLYTIPNYRESCCASFVFKL